MSSLYNLEPPPTAKVILRTTQGDIALELFAKQTPLTSRNFLQHCLDGYYDNTVFHRLVPGFILQGGDPTGLGTGGVSAINEDGRPFADEFHNRLRFNRRGLLGMANSGEPNDNTSQFFFTLDATLELQNKNTMFGRIEGDTIYNLVKMAEAELAGDGSERPLYPAKVLATEILVNPFTDMVKRSTVATDTNPAQRDTKPAPRKRKAGKTVLSFNDDDADTFVPVVKKTKLNPTLHAEKSASSQTPQSPPKTSRLAPRSPSPAPIRNDAPPRAASPSVASLSKAIPSLNMPIEKPMTALERTNQQIMAMKQSMKRGGAAPETSKPPPKKSALEAMVPDTATRGRKRGKQTDEPGALAAFNAFKARLSNMPTAGEDESKLAEDDAAAQADGAANDNGDDLAIGEEAICDLHFIANCKSCTSWDKTDLQADAAEDDDQSWLTHSLSFAKDTLGKDLEWKRKMEDLQVIDPREKAKEIASERKRTKVK